jgi:flagellar protein FlaJ
MGRLPDALKQLASNNSVGMSLKESLEAAAENTGGRLGTELQKVKNDIDWHNNINGPLIAFANRVKSETLARTVKLITEANKSTGDISDVLDVAAKDVSTRQKLKEKQKDALRMYTAVILISFAVYLFVIAVLDGAFLTQLANISAETGNQSAQTASGTGGGSGLGGGGGGLSMNLSDLPVDKFRMVFYHSTVVQALASGVLAGTLGSGDARSGLKYSCVLIVLATGLFWIIGTVI